MYQEASSQRSERPPATVVNADADVDVFRCAFDPINLHLIPIRSLADRIGDAISKLGNQGVVGFGAPEV
jgi:hypothetical protein